MLRTMAALLPIVGLVGTNNLSTAIIILGIGVILIFVAHPRYLPFLESEPRDWICREFFEYGKLSARTPCHLEGIRQKYEKGFQTIQGLYAIGSRGNLRAWDGKQSAKNWDLYPKHKMI